MCLRASTFKDIFIMNISNLTPSMKENLLKYAIISQRCIIIVWLYSFINENVE